MKKLLSTEVINAPGVSANELFIRARDWLNLNMTNLRIQDKGDGQLSARGIVQGQVIIRSLGAHTVPGTFAFLFNVWVKYGRYELEVGDIENTLLNDNPAIGTLGVLYTSTHCQGKMFGFSQTKVDQSYQTAKDSFGKIEADMSASFKTAMTQPSTPEF